ncbi:lysis protein [Salmonella enterica subsp. enterica serovar Lubbock]|uniref:Lysis protein n=6 Tax=Salmonella enterica TaxID=28901 RepID=A0A3V9PLK8_SALET|nr:lysis protein [Salmonella enterica]ECW4108050.1 lysis protein [Salmonella enterica subsp. enterica serovar Newport]EDG5981448.1 lysis protein [Salmonella enterica subsp. enterica serovar Infantis]EDL0614751.1 lysis protein [Salmonella enterica subsp. enterica serovar Typhimurium]EDW7338609.1 lysis protein [Salmonella enterica subsp. enterica serovar London]EEL9999625.1 lysis protein [Salmonella enterica subsp. enterica serovar Montevideo]EGZ3824261.1 lysis protein [Salmonella enterica subs
MNRITTGVIVSLLIVAAALAWTTDHYHGNAVKYKDQRDTVTHKLALANATITDMQTRQRDVAALDAKYTKELADAKAENDALQRRLAAGGRVRVKGHCTVPASTTSASASRMGNAATVELSDVTGRNVLSIRSGIISDQAKLKYLQEYVRTQCLK